MPVAAAPPFVVLFVTAGCCLDRGDRPRELGVRGVAPGRDGVGVRSDISTYVTCPLARPKIKIGV